MNKYIKLEDAINDLDNLWNYDTVDGICSSAVLKQVKSDLRNLPTIDIVRCKDCFHYTQRTEHTGICDFWNAGVAFKDFCSMANQEPMLERIEE